MMTKTGNRRRLPFIASGVSNQIVTPPPGNGFWGFFGESGYGQMSGLQPTGGNAALISVPVGFIFYISKTWVISKATTAVVTLLAGSTCDVGLYTYNPVNDATVLVADTGIFSTASAIVQRISLRQGVVTLSPGWYVQAQTNSVAATLLMYCLNLNNATNNQFNIYENLAASGRVIVSGANAAVGSLPASMGALTGLTTTPNPIAVWYSN